MNVELNNINGVLLTDIASILLEHEICELHQRINDDWCLPNFRVLVYPDGKIYAIKYPLLSADSVQDITTEVRDILGNRHIQSFLSKAQHTHDSKYGGNEISYKKLESSDKPQIDPIVYDNSYKPQRISLDTILNKDEVQDFYKTINAYHRSEDSGDLMMLSTGQIIFFRHPVISFSSALEVTEQLQQVIGKTELKRRLKEAVSYEK